MKKNFDMRKILIIILFISGCFIFCFPYIISSIFQRETENNINDFKEYKESKEVKSKYDELFEQLNKYNQSLYETEQKELKDPWAYEQVGFELEKYGFPENMIGYISIDKININLPIYLGANNENMKKGATLMTQTSIPIGGVNHHAVIAAHRGMKESKMFRDIDQLELGDEVKINNIWGEIIYEVSEIRVIEPDDIEAVLIQGGKDMISLISCHPFPYNYQRLIVYCERKGS